MESLKFGEGPVRPSIYVVYFKREKDGGSEEGKVFKISEGCFSPQAIS